MSVQSFIASLLHIELSEDKKDEVAFANLDIATDEQIKGWFNTDRKLASKHLKKAINKRKRGFALRKNEILVSDRLRNSFVWNNIFSGEQVFREFMEVLKENELIQEYEYYENSKLEIFYASYFMLDS